MSDKKSRELVKKYYSWLKTGEGTKPDLREANLREASLWGADLRGAKLPAPTMILLAGWGVWDLPGEITLALMRLDCSAHPVGKRTFDEWASGGDCPYSDCRFQRVALFNEKSSLWSYGPPPSIWKCCKMVLDHCCPGWDEKN